MWVLDENTVLERKPFDGILKHHDLTPNAMGFQKVMKVLGVSWLKYADAEKKIKAKNYSRVLILGLEGQIKPGAARLLTLIPKGTQIAVHATSYVALFEKCDWVLPNVSSYEKSGTMLNADGRLQRLSAAIPPQHTSRNLHQLIFGLSRGSDRETLPPGKMEQVFDTVIRTDILNKDVSFRLLDSKGFAMEEGVT